MFNRVHVLVAIGRKENVVHALKLMNGYEVPIYTDFLAKTPASERTFPNLNAMVYCVLAFPVGTLCDHSALA